MSHGHVSQWLGLKKIDHEAIAPLPFSFPLSSSSFSSFPSPPSPPSPSPPKKVQKRGKTPPPLPSFPKKTKHKKTHQSSHRPDQPRSIILKPRRRIRTQQDRTRKRQQHARHDRRQEHFVDAHVGFGGSCATAEFDGFFGGVGVHDDVGILLSMMMMMGEMMLERHGFRGEGGLVCLVSRGGRLLLWRIGC